MNPILFTSRLVLRRTDINSCDRRAGVIFSDYLVPTNLENCVFDSLTPYLTYPAFNIDVEKIRSSEEQQRLMCDNIYEDAGMLSPTSDPGITVACGGRYSVIVRHYEYT